MRKVRIGLLCDYLAPLPSYSVGGFLPIHLYSFTPETIDWELGIVRGLQMRGGKWVPYFSLFPEAVYNCCYSDQRRTIAQLGVKIGEGKIFNTINRLNKLEVGKILLQSSLKEYLPNTVSFSFSKLAIFLTRYRNVIIKPNTGHLGMGIYTVHNVGNDLFHLYQDKTMPIEVFSSFEDLRTWLKLRLEPPHFLIQQEIRLAPYHDRFFDIRLLVQKNGKGQWEVTAELARVAKPGYFLTNVVDKVVSATQLLRKMSSLFRFGTLEDIALSVTKEMDGKLGHFGELSVDFGLDNDLRPWVIEVNGKPAKELFAEVDGFSSLDKIYRYPLSYALFLAQQSL